MAQAPQNQQRIIVTGTVQDTRDPQGLGRIQVKLQGFNQEVTLPWVRVAWLHASKDFGQVVLPEKDDEVVVLQGAGNNQDQMICLGSVYNGNRKPPYSNADGNNDKKVFRTRSGHLLEFDDHSGGEKVTLQTPDGAVLLELDHAGSKVTIKCSKEVSISCPGGKVNIECATAEINASSQATVKAPQIKLSGVVDMG